MEEKEKERNLTEKRKDRKINSTRQTSRMSDKWAGAGATELKENADFVSISRKEQRVTRHSSAIPKQH